MEVLAEASRCTAGTTGTPGLAGRGHQDRVDEAPFHRHLADEAAELSDAHSALVGDLAQRSQRIGGGLEVHLAAPISRALEVDAEAVSLAVDGLGRDRDEGRHQRESF